MRPSDALKRQLHEMHRAQSDRQVRCDELRAEIARELIRIEAFESALKVVVNTELEAERNESSDQFELDGDQDSRRMRLGAKKRVVYQLIADGADNIVVLGRKLMNTDIDGRYAREVIRSGLRDGDLEGEFTGKLAITNAGVELLEKAPLPREWADYDTLFQKDKASASKDTEASTDTEEDGESSSIESREPQGTFG